MLNLFRSIFYVRSETQMMCLCSRLDVHTTSEHWMNLSDVLKNPMFNHYVVYVRAVQGDEMSDRAVSQIFSFNDLAMSTIKCTRN